MPASRRGRSARRAHALARAPREVAREGSLPIVDAARAAKIRLPGFVPDGDLAALYAGCELFCYPSLYEGFGLPVLEALRAGAPVLTSNLSSLPEVTGDAAVLVDPLSVDAIRAGIERILADAGLRERLRAAGPRRAELFSWEGTARETRDVLRALAAARARGASVVIR